MPEGAVIGDISFLCWLAYLLLLFLSSFFSLIFLSDPSFPMFVLSYPSDLNYCNWILTVDFKH